MNKMLAIAMTSMLLLAGCLDAEDAVGQIDDVIDIVVPGCDNPDAYNYNNSSDNELACLSQEVLTEALSTFVLFMDNGPQMGDTAGLTQHAVFQQTGMDGEMVDTELTSTLMVSPNGSAMSTTMDFGSMGEFAQTWWAYPGEANTTSIFVDYNGEEFMMTSAMTYTETMADFIGSNEMDDGMDNDNTETENMTNETDSSTEDLDAPEVDFSLYDWNSTNFAMELDLTNPEAMFSFSADVSVEGTTHAIDVKVNEAFAVRAITVHYPDFNETVTMTLHTEAEVSSMLAEGTVAGPAMEALPFTIEPTLETDMEPMATDADGNPLFVTLYECTYLVGQTSLANASHEEVVNSSTLNASMCGTEADAYTMTANETFGIPFDTVFVLPEMDMGLMFTNDTSATTYRLMHEGNTTTEEDCNMYGTWDNTSSLCVEGTWVVDDYDAGAILIDDELAEYAWDGVNNVLLFMFTEDSYVCDNGDYVPADWYHDGEEDCMDGSDEPDSSSHNGDGSVDFVDAYDCIFFLDTAALVGENSTFFESLDTMSVDTSMCGTLVNDHNHTFTQTNVTVPTNLMFFDDGNFANVTHDGVNLTLHWNNWSVHASGATDCAESGGTYLNSTDICEVLFDIVNADGSALELYNALSNETDHLLYNYNPSTMSGVFMMIQSKFMCDDGQLIDDYQFDDMHTDCIDGSDEPGMSTSPTVDWNFGQLEVGSANEDGFEVVFYSGVEHVDAVEFMIWNNDDASEMVNWTVSTSDLVNGQNNESYITMTIQSLVDTYMLSDGCYSIDARIEYDNSSETYGTSFCVGDVDHGTGGDDDSNGHWTIYSGSEMFAYSGDFADYSIVLSDCDDVMTEEDEMTLECGDDVVSVTIASVLMTAAEAEEAMMNENTTIVFVDFDDSGTITSGDMIGVPGDGGTTDDWNTVRLHSTSADAYSDENPTLPGFTGVLATLALLGAVMVRREN
ncbi:LDL receptor domain-containing protein [Candidatus Poseidonia sp.]|nr:LDL receptor domain-containing protein [Poseidonia sp.]